MPRKPKPPETKVMLVTVNQKPVTIYLHPPSGARKTWYAYWQGLGNPKSTGQASLEEATAAVQAMLTNDGKMTTITDAMLSDEEFEAIQRRHFGKKTDPSERVRAEKTLEDCLDAIAAFKDITGLKPITLAT